jgi:uracil-DNA glycosylase
MSDPNRLGQEMLEHLKFYRDLGVQWVDRFERVDSEMKIKSKSTEASPATESLKKAIVANTSLFDSSPGKEETLASIRTDIGDCQRCKLAKTRNTIVFGSGNPKAELMFIGEAPGAEEDAQGLPFVGRAGQLLTKIIEAIGMRREDVYIGNIIKCRPPQNRNPESDEIASCEPFLFRQIAAIKPKVICALGTYGAQTLLRTKEPISRLRGYFIDYRGAKLMATFHPAYLLRNPQEKRRVWEDMQKIRDYLRSQH